MKKSEREALIKKEAEESVERFMDRVNNLYNKISEWIKDLPKKILFIFIIFVSIMGGNLIIYKMVRLNAIGIYYNETFWFFLSISQIIPWAIYFLFIRKK